MQKNKKVALIGTIITSTLILGMVVVGYIGNLKTEIENSNKKVLYVEELNSNLNKELKGVNGELQLKMKQIDDLTKEKSELEEENKTLTNKVESLKKELQEKVYPTQSLSRSVATQGTPITMTLTFYGDGAEENGGYAGITAYGQKLSGGMVASNVYPRHTQFVTPDGKVLTVNDKGGKNFNRYNRLDVFVPRLSGESKSAYDKRISRYGVRTITLYKR